MDILPGLSPTHQECPPNWVKPSPVQPHIGVGTLELAATEAFDLLVQFGTQAADLAFADALHAECLHQVVDTPRGNALDIGFLDHRHKRLLSTSSGFEQAWKKAAV